MEIHIGNLPKNFSKDELSETFKQFGEVESAKIILDPITHESKGYGFVKMKDDKQAQIAISQLDGQEIDGNVIFVNKARKEHF